MRKERIPAPARTRGFLIALLMAATAIAAADSTSSDLASNPSDATTQDEKIRSKETVNAPQFSLEDQFGKSHVVSFPCEKESVIIVADKKGSKQVEKWIRLLVENFNDRADIHGIAVLKGVPDALRPTVRYIFRRNVKQPVMLDWTGSVSEKFQTQPDKACLFVVNRQGVIVHSEYGSADEERAARVIAALNNELNAFEQKDR